MFLRSTEYERTFASLEHNLRGLYPLNKRSPGDTVLEVHTRDASREYLHAGDSLEACPALVPLFDKLEDTQAFKDVKARVDVLASELEQKVGTNALPALRDHALCRQCSGQRQFAGLDPDLFEQINQNYTELYYLRRSTDALLRLEIGPFFNDVVRIWGLVRDGQAHAPKWAHFSGHDSTLTAVLSALAAPQVKKNVWPPYATHVELELWQHGSNKDLFFAQVVVNGEVIKPFGLDTFMTPFETFVKNLSDRNLLISEDEWRQVCRP